MTSKHRPGPISVLLDSHQSYYTKKMSGLKEQSSSIFLFPANTFEPFPFAEALICVPRQVGLYLCSCLLEVGCINMLLI